jgi:spore photoproduct lyase
MTISRLFVDRCVADSPVVTDFCRRIGLTPTVTDDAGEVYQFIKTAHDPWSEGKKTLLLTRNQGPFLKKCPGTREYICCDYSILHTASYCVMDCAYCILQSFFHPPILIYYVNVEDCFAQITQALAQSKTLRVGTGEYSDSLIWDAWSDTTPRLIDIFARQKRSVLELKTKTTTVDFLQGMDHRRKTILAWSLNTPRIIATQEKRTSSLQARLRAAARCQRWNYPLAFHFDPLVIYPGCEEEYRSVIEDLFALVSPDNVVWISLGTFRFMPDLKPIVQARFPESAMVHGEFVLGLDKKMRYFKPLRMDLYRRMAGWIKTLAPQTTVYLCMEDESVWRESLGFIPEERGGLPAMLDRSAKIVCELES